MARDYRNSEVFSTGTRPLPLWLWFFAALAISGFVGLIYYLDKYEKTKSEVDAGSVSVQESTDTQSNSEKTKKETNTSFDFYKLLPNISVDVPKAKTEVRNQPVDINSQQEVTQSKQPQPPAFSYVLQVGSFKDFHEADRLKARLAFLGIEVKIIKVTLNSTDIWHRVRIGPIQSEREMNRVKSQLRKQQIEPITLKVKT